MNSVRHLRISVGLLVAIIAIGTLGYSIIEGWTAFDALYMTIITLSSVGDKAVHDMSSEGKLFTIFLIISGTGMIASTLSSLLRFTLEGQLRKVLGRKKLESRISKLKNHYIICGEFQSRLLPFVVVEKDPNLKERINREVYMVMQPMTKLCRRLVLTLPRVVYSEAR